MPVAECTVVSTALLYAGQSPGCHQAGRLDRFSGQDHQALESSGHQAACAQHHTCAHVGSFDVQHK